MDYACFLCLAFFLLSSSSSAEPTSDKQALIDFISNQKHSSNRVKWDLSTPTCQWTGVLCDSSHSYVYELHLPGVGLVGQIPVNTIGRLTQLRVLSLRSNWLSGSLPPDFANLTSLRSLYLHNNALDGTFPETLTKLPALSRIDFSNNRFHGEIPASIRFMSLRSLFLQKNGFSGSIPPILSTSGLGSFDVSDNNLTGEIPETLSKFPESSFSGNFLLCGKPLPPCHTPAPSPSPYSPPPHSLKSTKLSTGAIIGIAAAIVVALLLLLLLLFCCFRRSRSSSRSRNEQQSKQSTQAAVETAEAGLSSSKEEVLEDDTKHELVFLNGDKDLFSLEDLLQASAEVLGKGTTGSSYKAELEGGITVAVKRMKDVVVGKTAFESQMSLLGHIRHGNVLKLTAYYYSKDEKLLISNYISAGSLASLLHGRRASGRVPLDWATRFRIGLTAAKGLQYLHTSAGITHGNVKASNILITKSLEATISDYGLNSLFGPSAIPNRVTGYRAPEVQQEASMLSFKSDVYSYGVLLLELLTGKAPIQVASLGDDGIDLPRWVNSVMSEAFDAEIYDAEVVGTGAEEMMIAVLHVAMMCVEVVPEKRPDMGEVVRLLEMVESGSFRPQSGSQGNTSV